MLTSDGSGLPEPENPTGFGLFFQARSYPNPKFSVFHKPEATRTRTFWVFIDPKLPEPELQTRGYPTSLKPKKSAQNQQKSCENCPKIGPKIVLSKDVASFVLRVRASIEF